MDYEAALARIERLIADIGKYGAAMGMYDSEQLLPLDSRILEGAKIANDIATKVGFDREMRPIYQFPAVERWRGVGDTVRALRAVLVTAQESASILGPDGPSMAAESLHPAIWNAALYLWNDGHYRAAVQTAATALEMTTKAKLGISLSGSTLFEQAFTLNAPKDDRPRLRLPIPESDTERYKSQHEGAMSLGAGAMKLIRNDTSHDTTELPENVAFEYLAMLSIVARKVELAGVVQSSGS